MKKAFIVVSLLVSAVMLLTACGPAVTPTPVVTEPPVPTANPLGTAAMPIVLAFAPSVSAATIAAGGQPLIDKLTELTGYEFTISNPTSYAALIEAMGSHAAQIGLVPPAAYTVANALGYADVAMVSTRNGADHYAFQFFVNQARVADGTFTLYNDPATGANTADAATALAQFAGKKPCWTDPLSASGYLLPNGTLANLGITTKAGAWVQGHATVAMSVYLSPKGEICDFGATYVPVANISSTFPDYLDVLKTVWISDPIVPNDTISFGTDVPADMRANIVSAFMTLASNADGLALLKNAGYSWGGLKEVDDSFFDSFRVLLQSMNFDFNHING